MKRILKIILIFVLALILATCALCAALTITEYKPEETETLTSEGNSLKTISENDIITLLSYNIGYASLSADMDLYSDGGSMVSPQEDSIVQRNLDCMLQIMKTQDCDLYFMQEVDEKSSRSHKIDMVSYLKSNLPGNSIFAYDYKCKMVPFPITSPTGSVASGNMTTSKFQIADASRQSFISDKKWPFKIFSKKEAFVVSRIKLANDEGKELVAVNVNFYEGQDNNIRIEQLKQLSGFLNDEYQKGNYVIAGGTFNQTFPGSDPSKHPIRSTDGFVPGIIEASIFGEGWSYAYDEYTPTARLMNAPYNQYDPYTQYYVIDGFILSPNITLMSVSTINTDFKYSKHQPVKARIMLGSMPDSDDAEIPDDSDTSDTSEPSERTNYTSSILFGN